MNYDPNGEYQFGATQALCWLIWVDKWARENLPVLYWGSVGGKVAVVAYQAFKSMNKVHVREYELYRSSDLKVTNSHVSEYGVTKFKELKPGASPIGQLCLSESFHDFEAVRADAERQASAQFGEPVELWRKR